MSISKEENKLKSLSDEDLCRMTVEGDDHAFSELVCRYNNLITLKVLSCCKYNVDLHDLQDLFQEGVLGFFSAVKTYDEQKGASFKTYASICVERKIINSVKSFLKKKNLDEINFIYQYNNDIDSLQNFSEYKSQNPEDLVIDCESLDIKKEKIKKLLSKLEYNVLSLYLTGHNYDEIAQQLNVNAKCVDNALQRIRRKLLFLKKI